MERMQKVFGSKGVVALPQFTVYCWPAAVEENMLQPLGFLDWLFKPPLAE